MTLDSLLADERDLGYGAGLSFVAPLGVTQALGRLMRDFGPVTFRMCAASACASCAGRWASATPTSRWTTP